MFTAVKFFLYFLLYGNNKKTKHKANPKWIALAGTSINTPNPKIKGSGDAYQSWNNAQIKPIKYAMLIKKELGFETGFSFIILNFIGT